MLLLLLLTTPLNLIPVISRYIIIYIHYHIIYYNIYLKLSFKLRLQRWTERVTVYFSYYLVWFWYLVHWNREEIIKTESDSILTKKKQNSNCQTDTKLQATRHTTGYESDPAPLQKARQPAFSNLRWVSHQANILLLLLLLLFCSTSWSLTGLTVMITHAALTEGAHHN